MKKIIFALMSVGGFMLAGCGGGAPAGKGGTPSDMPGWVMEQPPLCGVGIQKFRGNLGAAKAAAEGKARDDLSRQLETKVKNMIKSYQAEGGTADGDFSEEQTTNVSVQLSKSTLQGARPKKAYLSKEDKQFYSLVCLDPGVLTDAIAGMKELGEAQRKALANRAKAAEADLMKQMENY